ncbi:MAG: hypothetical protein ACFB00_06255 [Parvularculaceae bacterium]
MTRILLVLIAALSLAACGKKAPLRTPSSQRPPPPAEPLEIGGAAAPAPREDGDEDDSEDGSQDAERYDPFEEPAADPNDLRDPFFDRDF